MDVFNNALPCMPMPIIPKRTRLAESANMGNGSSTNVLAAIVAPAAAALTPRNFLRENSLFFMDTPEGLLFLQHLHRHFLEIDDVVVAVVLQSNVRSEERRVGKECRSRWA